MISKWTTILQTVRRALQRAPEMISKARKWTMILFVMLLMSFASCGVTCAMLLCDLVPTGAQSYDSLRVALALLQGRLKDIDTKFGDAFRELMTAMKKI